MDLLPVKHKVHNGDWTCLLCKGKKHPKRKIHSYHFIFIVFFFCSVFVFVLDLFYFLFLERINVCMMNDYADDTRRNTG